jgi:hypothetical protein
MPDYLGSIPVPEVSVSGTFPLVPEWGLSYVHEIPTVEHVIENRAANRKISQRFVMGSGARVFSVRVRLTPKRRAALRDFWVVRKGSSQPFVLNWPDESGAGTTAYTVTFENAALSWEYAANALATSGLKLVEVKTGGFPVYAVNSTQDRFPSGDLASAMTGQAQEIIPLVHIKVKDSAVTDNIYLSDRRCTVGGQLYQSRLIDWDGISQALSSNQENSSSDTATFRLGNADRVMTALANAVNLDRATVSFSLYHVGTGIKLDIWGGDVTTWTGASTDTFSLVVGDPAYELKLLYPMRKASRVCGKVYGNAATGCIACKGDSAGLDLVHFASANAATCDKGYNTANGCLAHSGTACPNAKRAFGGIQTETQGVNIKFTGSSGGVRLTSTSLINDSIYSEIIPEVYTGIALPVPCLLAAGREENDFYIGLGVVCEGPISHIHGDYTQHTLDGSYAHGPYPKGIRHSTGPDPALQSSGVFPATADHYFSLGQVGDQRGSDWTKAYIDGNMYADVFAGGTAFLEIRRSDAAGLQLAEITTHTMVCTVDAGLGGWYWDDTLTRQWAACQTNPVWIAVNAFLRSRGLWRASAADQEAAFVVKACHDAASICNMTVTRIFGTGTETQFVFSGIIRDQKPLREWLQDILNNALGWFTFSNHKLKIGIRENSSAVEAYTTGNIIANSLSLEPFHPAFNRLVGNFSNSEYQVYQSDGTYKSEWKNDNLPIQDEDYALAVAGGSNTPVYTQGEMNFCGASTRSQVARIIITRLREELGGITAAEWAAARKITFKTTILGLHSEVGQCSSLTHPDMPNGTGEFRITSWRLNPDWSVEISGTTTTDSMYDYTIGPKPPDVTPTTVPVEGVTSLVPGDVQPIDGQAFKVTQTNDGTSTTFLVEYDPPATFGVFSGVRALWDQDCDGQIAESWSFDYNGDSTAAAGTTARHGTAKVTVTRTNSEQAGLLYLVPRSRVFTKAVGLAGTSAPSPYRALSVPAVSNVPYPWSPAYAAVKSGDAYPARPAGFGVQVVYDLAADGSGIASVKIKGTEPPTALSSIAAPTVTASAASGGGLEAGTYYVAATALNSGGRTTGLGLPTSVTVSAGQQISCALTWGTGSAGGSLYASRNGANGPWYRQAALTSGQSSASLSTFTTQTEGAPDSRLDHLEVCPFRETKGGIAGQPVEAVTATTIKLQYVTGMATNAYSGRIVSVLRKANDSDDVDFVDFKVASNDSTTLTIGPNSLGVQPPDLATIVGVGDLVFVRMQPTSVTADGFTDALVNSFYPDGMVAGQNEGDFAWVLKGTGAGQLRQIASNTDDSVTLSEKWDVWPDSTSVIVFISQQTTQESGTQALANSAAIVGTVAQPSVVNLSGQTWVIQVLACNSEGSADTVNAPLREIHVAGKSGTEVTIYDDYTQKVSDQNIRCITSSKPIVLQALAKRLWAGRRCTIWKDTTDTNTVTVLPASGEDFDGAPSIVLRLKSDGFTMGSTN